MRLIDNQQVRDAAELIGEVFQFSCVGGNLHIAIEDENLSNDDLKFCSKSIADNVHGSSDSLLDLEQECLDALAKLTYRERVIAVSIAKDH
jgi:hypothetical protein